MKRKIKKPIKVPQRSLPSYIEEFALLLRKKAHGPIQALPAKSSSKPVSTVVEQIALILRKQAQKKTVKGKTTVAVRGRKTKRVKK